MIRTAGVDIREEVARRGYCFVPAGKFVLSQAARDAAEAVKSEWDSLEADPYLMAVPCYRFRRHAQFRFDESCDRLHRLPDGPYCQSLESNHLYGGRERTFAPFTPLAAGNPFLAGLIRFNARQLTLHDTTAIGKRVPTTTAHRDVLLLSYQHLDR